MSLNYCPIKQGVNSIFVLSDKVCDINYVYFDVLLARSSKCHVRDWVGIVVSVGCILCGVICITVISLYKEKVKEEVRFPLKA